MFYLADATYLVFVGEGTINMHAIVPVKTIHTVAREAELRLKDPEARQTLKKQVEIIPAEKSQNLSKDFPNLSSVDQELLQTATRHKDDCALITDDGLLKQAAEQNRVKAFSTPSFIEHLVKHKIMEKETALSWLSQLTQYPRQNALHKTIQKIKGW